VLKKELLGHLRSKRRIRRSQHARIYKDSRGQIAEAISIRERPAEVADRAIPDHWEGDLLSGSKNSHIVTLVERHSRFTTLIKVPSKDTAVVVAALTRLPAALRCSLTWDRGLEMAQHKIFTMATDVKFISVTRKVLGSAARTKTQMGYYDNTSLGEPTCRVIPKRIWTKWRCD